jgi:C1A family cysteine protease
MIGKKLIGIFTITLMIGINVFSAASSSSDNTTTYLGKQCPCEDDLLTSGDSLEINEIFEQELDRIPPSWDWREVNGSDWTTPIKDQLQDVCGSCWAFGTLGGLEATIKIWQNNPTLEIDLSEQYMLSCSPGGCGGWYMDRTIRWIKTNGSIPESCFQYSADDTIPCEAKCDDWHEKLVGIDGFMKISSNVTVIQGALIQYGPLPATMVVYSDFYPDYEGGVYHHTNGTYVFGHVVTIVGYDTIGEEGYWICKNSWGTSWGESGWFRIAFGECKIERGVYCYTGPNYVIVRPEKPDGKPRVESGKTHAYTIAAVDPDDDMMKYCFDWGDGNIEWTDLNASGETVSMNHAWTEKGKYDMRVKVKDEHDLESDWSEPLSVSVPKYKISFNHLFENLGEHILRLFFYLRT